MTTDERRAAYDDCLNAVAEMMTEEVADFVRVLRFLLPDCRICEDEDGQIVVYTGACVQMGGTLDVWEPEDEDAYKAREDRHPEIA